MYQFPRKVSTFFFFFKPFFFLTSTTSSKHGKISTCEMMMMGFGKSHQNHRRVKNTAHTRTNTHNPVLPSRDPRSKTTRNIIVRDRTRIVESLCNSWLDWLPFSLDHLSHSFKFIGEKKGSVHSYRPTLTSVQGLFSYDNKEAEV